MASLPSNTFMFNYNAREYNSSTHTFPKTQGQLFDEDLVLNKAISIYTGEALYFGGTAAYMGKQYSTSSQNPFNRDSSNSSFTFIYKTSGFTSVSNNLIANRGSNYNYMVRGNKFHTSDSNFLNLTPSASPEICLIRIYSDGRSERKFLDSNGTVLQSTSSATISWGAESNAIGFFSGYGNSGNECFADWFYWMYCSLETLTDAEVLQVIKYNEPATFGPDDNSFSATYTGLTTSTTLNAEDLTWSAATVPSWITVSPSTGSGTTPISIAIAQNNAYSARTGSIIFTSSESDTAEIAITQAKHPLLVPDENIYRADLEVVKEYRSGSTINKAYRSGELILWRRNPSAV